MAKRTIHTLYLWINSLSEFRAMQKKSRIIHGCALDVLSQLPSESVQTCVTSPPYWGLRCYGVKGQFGLEKTPDEYVANLVEVFREVRRVLKKDGTVFLNLGDSYFGGGQGGGGSYASERRAWRGAPYGTSGRAPEGLTGRDCLCGSLCDACRVAYQIGKSRSGGEPAAMQSLLASGSILARKESASGHLPTSGSSRRVARTEDAISRLSRNEARASERLRASRASKRAQSSLLPSGLRSGASIQAAECLLCARSLASYEHGSDDKRASLSAFRSTSASTRDQGKSTPYTASTDDAFSRRIQGKLCDCSSLVSTTEYRHSRLKPKDLVGIPWRVAFALQADGWYLRSDIIWHKPNPMPESITDRPTKSHEYIFLLSKSPRYFYDHEAVKEMGAEASAARYQYALGGQKTLDLIEANKTGVGRRTGLVGMRKPALKGSFDGKTGDRAFRAPRVLRNRRTVWTVTTRPFKGAHFATFPEALITPCILAGSAPGDLVLDPFNGAGTTGLVSAKHGRRYVGIELNAEYIAMSEKRLKAAA